MVWVEAGGTGAGLLGSIIIAAATIRSPLAAISAAAMSCGREGSLRQPRFPALRQTQEHPATVCLSASNGVEAVHAHHTFASILPYSHDSSST